MLHQKEIILISRQPWNAITITLIFAQHIMHTSYILSGINKMSRPNQFMCSSLKRTHQILAFMQIITHLSSCTMSDLGRHRWADCVDRTKRLRGRQTLFQFVKNKLPTNKNKPNTTYTHTNISYTHYHRFIYIFPLMPLKIARVNTRTLVLYSIWYTPHTTKFGKYIQTL